MIRRTDLLLPFLLLFIAGCTSAAAPTAQTPTKLPPTVTPTIQAPTTTATKVPATATATPVQLTPTPTATIKSATVTPTIGAGLVIPTALRGVPPLGKNDCPSDYPIKASIIGGDHIYHVQNGQFYGTAVPVECFANEADAKGAGYSKAER